MEQEELIAALQLQAAQQRQLTKLAVGGIGYVLALIFVYTAGSAVARPWGLRHHAHFYGRVKPASVAAGDVGTALSVFFSATAVLVYDHPLKVWRWLLQLSAMLGLLTSLFWSALVWQVLQEFSFHLVRGQGSMGEGALPTTFSANLWAAIQAGQEPYFRVRVRVFRDVLTPGRPSHLPAVANRSTTWPLCAAAPLEDPLAALCSCGVSRGGCLGDQFHARTEARGV